MGKIIHSHYQIRRHARPGEIPGSVRIAVLADLHNHVYRSDIRTVVEGIRSEGCDAVLSAGDLVLMRKGSFETDEALSLLGALAGTYPVFLSNGNHETRMRRRYHPLYRRYEASLQEMGVVRLNNESTDAVINGLRLHISGLELGYKCFRNKYHGSVSAQEIREMVGESAEDAFNILIAHHPKYFPEYARWGADLVLSGHLHGGIVRLPYLGGVISPDPELFPHFDHGLYEDGASSMIVSAGLGSHTINLRINNPPELVIADITVESNGN